MKSYKVNDSGLDSEEETLLPSAAQKLVIINRQEQAGKPHTDLSLLVREKQREEHKEAILA